MIRLSLPALLLAALPAHAETPERVVVLGGAVAEIAADLGATDHIVARDSTSTYPEAIAALPDLGYVRALSPEGVLSVDPGLILAEEGAGPPEAVAMLKASGVRYVEVPDGHDAAAVPLKIETIAAALDLADKGKAMAAEVAADLAEAEARAAAVTERKRVLFILSLQGGKVMAAGANTSAEGILALAGADNALTGFEGYKPVTEEALLAAAPDAILMMEREGPMTISDADILALPALAGSPAAANGAILRMDGMKLLGFGRRTAEAAAELHAALYGKP